METNYRKRDNDGMAVEVRNNNVDQAMRKLKKKLANDGIFQELRDRSHFVSNTEKRLRSDAAAKARHRKRIAQEKNQ